MNKLCKNIGQFKSYQSFQNDKIEPKACLRLEKWLKNEQSHTKLFHLDFLIPMTILPFF